MCKMKIKSVISAVLVYILVLISAVSADNQHCYTTTGVFGIVIASVIITLLVIGLALTALWFLWTKNRLKFDFILNKRKKNKTNVGKEADVESANHEYAFDNPYFKEDDAIDGLKKDNNQTQKESIILEGKEIAKEKSHEEVNNEKVSQDKQRNGQMFNNRFVKSLPLSAVFNHVPVLHKKQKQENQKSMDDSFIKVEPERLQVELIGHDFTGLGFNLCGNMKDGIFIKDVLNRGPANESGKVKAGDRIISVNVSFEKMVYEDAVAILSYASPYNVRIELEKSVQYPTIDKLSNSSLMNKNLGSIPDKQLLHPLYRSHSVDDLTRIGKELSLSEKSTSSAGKNVVQKIKSQIFNRKSNPVKPSDQSLNVKEDNSQICVIQLVDRKEEEENEPQKQTNTTPDETDCNEEVENVVMPEGSDEGMKEVSENQVNKKPVTPAKRKGRAPQPPIGSSPQTTPLLSESISGSQSNGETIETTAQVHSEQTEAFTAEEKASDEAKDEIESDIKIEELNGDLSSSSESISSEEHKKCSDLVPLQSNTPQRVQSPTGKPKSSSMSDLTNNNTDKLQSALLERAVSLDMNAQNLPEENLYQHPKNLLVPDDQNADSMPIINCWYMNKPIHTDTNSSESTLNELNQAFIINNDSTETLESSIKTEIIDNEKETIDSFNNQKEIIDSSDNQEEIIDSSHVHKDNISQNEVQTKLLDDTNFASHLSLQPNTSTPIKIDNNSAIDQHIKLDSSSSSSSSSSEDESEEDTLVGKSEPTSDSKHESKENNKNNKNNENNENKEVIELSQSELDGVMMSHKDFLIKQAKTNGSYPNISPAIKTIGVDSHLESLDFESWSYLSEDENRNNNQSQTDSTLYTTALDINDSNESENELKTKRLPEVAGITLKTGENGQLTNTIIITTDLSNSSFSSSSSSPPSN